MPAAAGVLHGRWAERGRTGTRRDRTPCSNFTIIMELKILPVYEKNRLFRAGPDHQPSEAALHCGQTPSASDSFAGSPDGRRGRE